MRFEHFVGIDWSGAWGPRVPGIRVAWARAGDGAPRLVGPPGGWTRDGVLRALRRIARIGARTIVGLDLSPTLPFLDAGGYFPGGAASPTDARALWALVDDTCRAEPHLGASGFSLDPRFAAHFRTHVRGMVATGAAYGSGVGRLRIVEHVGRAHGLPSASCFNLVGASQVGKSSLTGMRVLHRLAGAVPMWPFDPAPAHGPLLVEIYTTIAARAAGIAAPRSKVRDGAALDAALARLGSRPMGHPGPIDDHAGDAILTAAWLRQVADDAALWSPAGLTAEVAVTEGWTFGVA